MCIQRNRLIPFSTWVMWGAYRTNPPSMPYASGKSAMLLTESRRTFEISFIQTPCSLSVFDFLMFLFLIFDVYFCMGISFSHMYRYFMDSLSLFVYPIKVFLECWTKGLSTRLEKLQSTSGKLRVSANVTYNKGIPMFIQL